MIILQYNNKQFRKNSSIDYRINFSTCIDLLQYSILTKLTILAKTRTWDNFYTRINAYATIYSVNYTNKN